MFWNLKLILLFSRMFDCTPVETLASILLGMHTRWKEKEMIEANQWQFDQQDSNDVPSYLLYYFTFTSMHLYGTKCSQNAFLMWIVSLMQTMWFQIPDFKAMLQLRNKWYEFCPGRCEWFKGRQIFVVSEHQLLGHKIGKVFFFLFCFLMSSHICKKD